MIQTTNPARFFKNPSPKDTKLCKNPIMSPFTTHPQRQGITYFEHCCFAMGIAYRLLNSVVVFVVHALFPFISIEPKFDVSAVRFCPWPPLNHIFQQVKHPLPSDFATKLLSSQRAVFTAEDSDIRGFNVGVNDGEIAGQSIFHIHLHSAEERRCGESTRWRKTRNYW